MVAEPLFASIFLEMEFIIISAAGLFAYIADRSLLYDCKSMWDAQIGAMTERKAY